MIQSLYHTCSAQPDEFGDLCFMANSIKTGNKVSGIKLFDSWPHSLQLSQNFSVLSRLIYNSPFIASPLAIHSLLSVAHKDLRDRPRFIVQVEVVHDYKGAFKPLVNRCLNILAYRIGFAFGGFADGQSVSSICYLHPRMMA